MSNQTLAKQLPNPCFYIDDHGVAMSSSWNYDNRNGFRDGDGVHTGNVVSKNQPYTVSESRTFRAIKSGIVTLELQLLVDYDNGGLFVRLSDKQDKNLVNLVSKGGYLYNENKKVEAKFEKCVDGDIKLKICANLDEGKADIYVNGNFGAGFDTDKVDVEKIEIGIAPGGDASYKRGTTKLFADYAVNELFNMNPSDMLPLDFEFDGSFVMDKRLGTKYASPYSILINAKQNTCHKATKKFMPLCGKVTAQCYMLLDKAQSGSYFSLNCGGDSIVKVKTQGNTFVTQSGITLRNYTDFIWQVVRFEADTETQKVDIWIDGKKCVTADFDCKADFVDNVTVGFDAQNDAKMWFCDLQVFCYTEPEDYVPQPVLPKSLGYHIGINVCPLWREGIQGLGWDKVATFPDIEPVLGYYNEGMRETADWEIKFMAEHGINYQHICWYNDYTMIKNPIRRSWMDYSLHDGYFLAKYSDMMKFCLLWENTGVGVNGIDEFKMYLWNYWKDYYFTDPRYMTIDNKLIITVYDYDSVIKAFGDFDKAKQAIEFMNEDARQMGFDGMLIFFSLAGGSEERASFYTDVEKIGAQGSYAYGWFSDGAYSDKQIRRIRNVQSHKAAYHIPTLSTGFNNIGWSDVRKNVLTPQGFEEVCDFIKNTYHKEYDENSWKSKMVMLSNWNEYGEGTYIMPASVHGFGYLDGLRKYFTDDSGIEHIDHVPTEAQKARITTIYNNDRNLIRAWDYVDVEEVEGKLLLNSKPVALRFEPTFEEDEMYAVCEPNAGFFTRLGLYYEYNRFTGKLLIKGKENTVEFTVGTNKAVVDGKETAFAKKVELQDGIPVIPVKLLANAMGFPCKVDAQNKKCVIYIFGESTIEAVDSRKQGKWTWEVFGDKEGWDAGNLLQEEDKDCLCGYALKTGQHSEPVCAVGGLRYNVGMYNKIKIRLKYKLASDGTQIKIHFGSANGQGQPAMWDLGANSSNGKYVEIESNLEPFTKDRDILTSVRLEFGEGSEFSLDYVEFIENPDYVPPATEQEKKAEVINGDASDESNVPFFGAGVEISIVKDPDDQTNNVYLLKANYPYAYARQTVRYTYGETYVAEVDIRIISDKPASVYFNAVYAERERQDHVVGGVTGTYADGWLHFKGEFTVEKMVHHGIDQFAIFSNPVDDVPVNYYFDNAKLYKKE